MSYVIEWHGISQKFYVQTEPTQTVCLRIVYAELGSECCHQIHLTIASQHVMLINTSYFTQALELSQIIYNFATNRT